MIDIFVPLDAPSLGDIARWDEIKKAARSILRRCVKAPTFEGGYNTQIGM